eukprot:gene4558-40_t
MIDDGTLVRRRVLSFAIAWPGGVRWWASKASVQLTAPIIEYLVHNEIAVLSKAGVRVGAICGDNAYAVQAALQEFEP